jgi:hypothetical protein
MSLVVPEQPASHGYGLHVLSLTTALSLEAGSAASVLQDLQVGDSNLAASRLELELGCARGRHSNHHYWQGNLVVDIHVSLEQETASADFANSSFAVPLSAC